MQYRDIVCEFFKLAILRHPDIVRYRALTHVSHVHCALAQIAFAAPVT